MVKADQLMPAPVMTETLSSTLSKYRYPIMVICVGIGLSVMGFIMSINKNTELLRENFFHYSNTQYSKVDRVLQNYIRGKEIAQVGLRIILQDPHPYFNDLLEPLFSRGHYHLFTMNRFDDGEWETLATVLRSGGDSLFEVENLAKHPDVVTSQDQARRTGEFSIAGPVSVNGGGEEQKFLIVSFPVQSDPHSFHVVTGFLHLDAMFEQEVGWPGINSEDYRIYLFDRSEGQEKIIFQSRTQDRFLTDRGGSISDFLKLSPFYFEERLALPAQNWQLLIAPSQNYMAQAALGTPWVILILGLLLTSVVSTLLFTLTNQNIAVLRKVEVQTRAIRHSNEEKERFISIASHDLKEPLRSIKILADFVIEDSGDKLSPDSLEDLAEIKKQSDRMTNLITELRQYSKIGQMAEKSEHVDLRDLIHEIVAENKLRMSSEDMELSFTGTFATVYMPREHAAAIVRNLLTNAVKYNSAETKKIVIRGQIQPQHLIISIKDNGIGISEDMQGKVFDMFKVGHAGGEFGGGTGVGLAIVKKLIEAYNGSIQLASELGTGSEFTFTLPRFAQQNREL